MAFFCCGEDRPQHKDGGAAVQNEDGDYELSKDHATYMQQSAAKTHAKNKEISAAWSSADRSGSEEIQASARFWFEFQVKVADRLEEIKQIGKADEEKEDASDPAAAHDKFNKEINFILEESVMRIWKAYSEEDENGDRKLNKEASLRFYDDLVNRHEKMALHAIEDYTRYLAKFNAQKDESVKTNQKEFVDKAVASALKEATASALASAVAGAKQDTLGELKRANDRAKALAGDDKIDTKAADDKIKELEDAQAAKDEEEKKKKEDKEKADEEAKAKKLEKMSDDDKKKEEEKEAKAKEKADEKAAKEKKSLEDAQKSLADAVEEAADDTTKLEAAIKAAKANSAKPDTSEAEGKLFKITTEAADKATTENARTSASENWLLTLNNAVDTLILDATKDYQANSLNKQKAGMEKFYDGGNKAGDDYELTREYLEKILTIGAGDFEGFVTELGFTTDALEAVKGKLEKKDEKKDEKEEKKEEKKDD